MDSSWLVCSWAGEFYIRNGLPMPRAILAPPTCPPPDAVVVVLVDVELVDVVEVGDPRTITVPDMKGWITQ